MCFHIHEELLDEIRFWHSQGVKNVSGVQLYARSGRFIGSWVCYFDQPQSVANAVHALQTWHPGDYRVNLDLVNAQRDAQNLKSLRLAKLPEPEPLAFEGVKDDDSREMTRAVVTQWLQKARTASYARE